MENVITLLYKLFAHTLNILCSYSPSIPKRICKNKKAREGQQSDQRTRMASIRNVVELAGEGVFLQSKICQKITKI